MASSYKLRCALVGHEKDIRSVCNAYFPEGSIVSASRDVTTRLWVPNDSDLSFTDSHTMSGHGNFVVAVCVTPPDEQYPHGLIMTGSNDNNIHAYSLESPQPQYKLQGHTNTVCALASGKFGSLLSGSWDTTAKVWLNQKNVMTLKGHEAAVWAVAILPEGGYMLTASADKTCKLWRAGKCERTYLGHEDCVRGLAVLSSTEFLSCGNDASVRRWLVSGECTHVYYGHTNYVYSISIMPNGEDFVTGGEDRTLRVWKSGECVQTISHPTESVWSVCALPNGDIATGASDGIVRIFSCNPERQADEGMQTAYEEQVASSSISSELGDIKPESLPGPEVLFNPGKKDGQTVMVREENNSITAHSWNAAEGRWVKVGDVVGSKGGSQNAGGKTNFMGKDYDYVFSVEIEEGKPPLKLPFNVGDDPWMSAHKFLERNDLSQLFLDQVANFILEQTKGLNISQAPPPQVSDPFTGAGRYIPGSASGQNGTSGSDPFTGAGRYIPGSTQNTQAPAFGADPFTGSGSYKPSGYTPSAPATNSFFPQTSYLFFENANPNAILGKIKDFNSKVEASQQLDENDIAEMESLMAGATATSKQLTNLWKILQWPQASLFPAVDVLRLSIRGTDANQHFFNPRDGPGFLSHLLAILNNTNKVPANQMLVLRSLCNALKHPQGETLLLAERDRVISGVLDSQPTGNKNIEVAFSTLLLNYAVAATKNNDIEAKSQLLSAALTQLQSQQDAEANFRILVSVGTLVSSDDNSLAMALSLGAGEVVDKFTSVASPPKVPECAKFVKQALK